MPQRDDVAFCELWQAHAFAIVLSLHEKGAFTWREWADALAAEITRAQQAGDPDHGDTYYDHWLTALERLVGDKCLSNTAEIDRHRHAWERALLRTPHGKPIELRSSDFDER